MCRGPRVDSPHFYKVYLFPIFSPLAFSLPVLSSIFSFPFLFFFFCAYRQENRPDVQEKVAARLVAGDAREIGNAKKIDLKALEGKDRKKNFGGSGTTSGDKTKGVKNAKRVSL